MSCNFSASFWKRRSSGNTVKRPLISLLVGCGLLIGVVPRASAGDADSNERAAERLLASTVTVRCTALKPTKPTAAASGAEEVTVCSGVVVGKNRIATFIGDRDCLSARFRVTRSGGEQATATLRVVDHYSGLVLLKLESTEAPALEPATDLPKIGGAVLTAAAAGIDTPAVSAGILSGVDRTLPSVDLPPLILCDVRATETSSGAAIVDHQGKLIGIVVANTGAGERPGWTYAVPVSHVERLLAAEKAGPVVELKRRRPAVGFTLGPGDKEGIVQVERIENGPAADAGIQPGDRIVEADGRRIRSAYQAVNRIMTKQPGDKVTLLIERGGQRKSVELTLGAGPVAVEAVAAADRAIVRVGPQLSVSNIGGNQIAVRNSQSAGEVAVDSPARSRWAPATEAEMLRIQVDAFEKVIHKLQSEIDARNQSQAETEILIEKLRKEISQLKKESGQGTTESR